MKFCCPHDKVTGYRYYYYLFVTYIVIKRNTKFQLEVSENRDLFLFSSKFMSLLYSIQGPFSICRVWIKNPWLDCVLISSQHFKLLGLLLFLHITPSLSPSQLWTPVLPLKLSTPFPGSCGWHGCTFPDSHPLLIKTLSKLYLIVVLLVSLLQLPLELFEDSDGSFIYFHSFIISDLLSDQFHAWLWGHSGKGIWSTSIGSFMCKHW